VSEVGKTEFCGTDGCCDILTDVPCGHNDVNTYTSDGPCCHHDTETCCSNDDDNHTDHWCCAKEVNCVEHACCPAEMPYINFVFADGSFDRIYYCCPTLDPDPRQIPSICTQNFASGRRS